MARSKTRKKKRGRPPRQKYFSAEELLAQSKSAMKKSQERLCAIDYEEAEEARLKVFKADKKNFLPDAELKELRRMAEQL